MIPPQLRLHRPAVTRPLIVGRPATVPSLHILDMDNSLLLLHPPAATVLAASRPLDMSRARIPSSLSKTPILSSSSSREDTRANKEATDSRAPTASREDINKLQPNSNRLHLPATPHLLGPTDSPLLVNTDSRPVLEEAMARQTINHPVSMVITDRTIRTARVEVVTQALNLEDMGALERAEGGRTAGVAGVGLTGG